jgi:carboxyl-terminal processing protease
MEIHSVNTQVRNWRTPVTALAAAVVLALAAVLALVACTAGAGGTAHAEQAGGQPPPPCARPSWPTRPTPSPTTVTTIEQAYHCIFARYYGGPVLDDRVLLAGAFAGLTQELDRLGLDQPDATMPTLTGSRYSDWAAFATVYQHVTSQAHPSAAQQQELAAATMDGMIASLDDNHAGWHYRDLPPPGFQPGDEYGLGIWTSPSFLLAAGAPAEALPPLNVTKVNSASPAASGGIRPGDIIESVNGSPPFAHGVLSPGASSRAPAPPTTPMPASRCCTCRWRC